MTREYNCGVCQKTFNTSSNLRQHEKTHEQDAPTYDCAVCGQKLARKAGLKRHTARRHPSPVEVEQPDAKRQRLVDYSDSEESEEEEDSAPSADENDTDERPFKCPVCPNKQFRTRKSYNQHLNDVHTVRPSFGCEYCGRPFYTSIGLRQHYASKHADAEQPSPPPSSPQPGPSRQRSPTPEIDEPWHSAEHWEMRLAGRKHSAKFDTTVYDFDMKVTDLAVGSLEEAHEKLYEIVESALDHIKKRASPRAYGRFVFQCAGLGYAFSTGYDAMDKLQAKQLVDEVMYHLNSQEEVDLNEPIKINFLHTALPMGAGGNRSNARNRCQPRINRWARKKRGLVDAARNAVDQLCLARVLCAAKYHLEQVVPAGRRPPRRQMAGWDRMSRGRGAEQTTLAVDLHQRSGLRGDGPYTPADARPYQAALGDDFQVIVYMDDDTEPACACGPRDGAPLFVYLDSEEMHYYFIANIKAFLRTRFYCPKCHYHTYHPERKPHSCDESKCRLCRQPNCANTLTKEEAADEPRQDCADGCNRHFPTRECLAAHDCDKFANCPTCRKLCKRELVNNPEAHHCMRPYCSVCEEHKPAGHLCFVGPPKDYQKRKEKGEPNPEPTRCFVADFESEIETTEHLKHNPCMVIMREMARDTPHVVLRGENCHVDFLEMLMTDETYHKSTIIFHGLGNYDGFIMLDAVHRTRVGVEPTYRNGRLLRIYLPGPKIRFIDSLMFFNLALSKVPASFGIPDMAKGRFPYKLASRARRGYRGKLPALEFYDPESCKGGDYESLVKWHAEETRKYEDDPTLVWSIDEEMEKYCKMDVDILVEACLKYREGMAELFEGLDVFKSTTLPSFCNYAFRALHMREETIAVLPPQGYAGGRSNYSMQSLAWLESEQKRSGERIRHARNGGEVQVGNCYVDGCTSRVDVDGVEQIVAYEFMGCYWHGCPSCYPPELRNKKAGKTMAQLDASTRERLAYLREHCAEVVVCYECDFKKSRAADCELETYYQDLKSRSDPLKPRDALRGGRCNVVRLLFEGDLERRIFIRYMDFTSMYPATMLCTDGEWWPVGHPDVYFDNFPDDMFGLVKAVILPPKRLYFPCLPSKIDQRVMFVLCRTCAEEGVHTKFCQHSEEERALSGTFCTPEIAEACRLGYKIVSIQEASCDARAAAAAAAATRARFQLWHWPKERRSQDLFKSFLLTALREKQEASGFPVGCDTPEQRQAYVDDYLERQGVQLRVDHIERNAGRRTIGKATITTLWGYFGKDNNAVDTKYLKERSQLLKMIADGKYVFKDVYMPAADKLVVRAKKLDEYEEPDAKGNVVIAALTTCYGRLKLNRLLQRLNERVLYFDTDSVFYVSEPGLDELETDNVMGALTNECTGDFGEHAEIIQFRGAGPKLYQYTVVDKRTGVKIKDVYKAKGFRFNQRTSSSITAENLESAIKQGARHSVVDTSMRRDLKTATIRSIEQTKAFRSTATKRILMRDYTSLPVGWVGTDEEAALIMPQRDIVDME